MGDEEDEQQEEPQEQPYQQPEEEEEEEKPKKEKKTVTIVLEEDSSKFRPVFYTFRRTDNKNVARGPPFWVLTDHLIAVIWHLFKSPPSEEPIGISQLQWSLEFLRNIRDETGEYPEYVNAAIVGLEDRLLELYASVPSFLEDDEPDVEEEGKEEGEEEEGEEGDEEEEKKQKGEEEETGEAEEEGEEEEDDDDEGDENLAFSEYDMDIDRPSESMRERMSSRRSSKVRAAEYRALSSSPTLKDIMQKAPKKAPKDPELLHLLQQTASGPSVRSSPSASQTKVSGSGTKIEGAVKNDMLRFLSSLRKEQTDRISIELKQLEKINEYLKEVEAGNPSYQTMQGIKEQQKK